MAAGRMDHPSGQAFARTSIIKSSYFEKPAITPIATIRSEEELSHILYAITYRTARNDTGHLARKAMSIFAL